MEKLTPESKEIMKERFGKDTIIALTTIDAGDWLTAHGTGINLGYFGKSENKDIAEKLKNAFCTWIDNGHNNFDDKKTCILCIQLTKLPVDVNADVKLYSSAFFYLIHGKHKSGSTSPKY